MITTIRLTDQLYLFQDAADCFANLVIGEKKALLYDTTCGMDDLKSAVEAMTSLPLLVLASHGHFDHVGGSHQFETVYLSKKDRNILDSYDEALLNQWIREMNPENDRMISFGCDGWKHIKDLDFDMVDLGNLHGDIVSIPGHSEGSVGVYIREWKLLLSGDAFTPIMCLIFPNHGNKETQLCTLEMINCLDFSYFLTSHSKKMYPKSLIQRMIDCIYHSEGKRHHAYQYPKPPYSKGYFYLDSLEDEPVGLIVEEMEK